MNGISKTQKEDNRKETQIMNALAWFSPREQSLEQKLIYKAFVGELIPRNQTKILGRLRHRRRKSLFSCLSLELITTESDRVWSYWDTLRNDVECTLEFTNSGTERWAFPWPKPGSWDITSFMLGDTHKVRAKLDPIEPMESPCHSLSEGPGQTTTGTWYSW